MWTNYKIMTYNSMDLCGAAATFLTSSKHPAPKGNLPVNSCWLRLPYNHFYVSRVLLKMKIFVRVYRGVARKNIFKMLSQEWRQTDLCKKLKWYCFVDSDLDTMVWSTKGWISQWCQNYIQLRDWVTKMLNWAFESTECWIRNLSQQNVALSIWVTKMCDLARN